MRQPFNASAGSAWGRSAPLLSSSAGKTASLPQLASQICSRGPIASPMVIFDEVDKASPEVLKELLKIMDEGIHKPEVVSALSGNAPYLLCSEEVVADGWKSLDDVAVEATVLQSPITVGRPISFKNRFAFF